jgi:hypothetical protein
MYYIKVRYCILYKQDEIILVHDYCYDEKFKQTNILVKDARLSEIVSKYMVKTQQIIGL